MRLKSEVSRQYSGRPEEELFRTVGNAYDSFCSVISDNDFSHINTFINEITRIRLDAGFPLEDVQKAFELFRDIVLLLACRHCNGRLRVISVIKENAVIKKILNHLGLESELPRTSPSRASPCQEVFEY